MLFDQMVYLPLKIYDLYDEILYFRITRHVFSLKLN